MSHGVLLARDYCSNCIRENTMIRFVDSVPRAVFFSQHATGIAVDYAAVEKIGKRVCFNRAHIRNTLY